MGGCAICNQNASIIKYDANNPLYNDGAYLLAALSDQFVGPRLGRLSGGYATRYGLASTADAKTSLAKTAGMWPDR